MYAKTFSRACVGMSALLVTVETDLSGGLPRFSIVGLPETAIKESRDRVRSAILNSNFEMPNGRITINLAPADFPKEGAQFDLAIAIGILAASRQIPDLLLGKYEFAGELGLSGELRPVRGALAFAYATREENHTLILPHENAPETTLIRDVTVLPARSLVEVCNHLKNHTLLSPYQSDHSEFQLVEYPDLKDIHGQHIPRYALELAAAGGHNLLMVGPPGTGKTMLALRLPGLLPPLSDAEALEVALLYSLRKITFQSPQWRKRPFRTPHHNASSAAMVGGGSVPLPGEISLAHQGILFLDELPEFNRHTIEMLREPLQSRSICVSRTKEQVCFPADFQLVAAMNPCPCGYLEHPRQACRCSTEQIRRYQNRLSGPFLDRIDLHVKVPVLSMDAMTNPNNTGESTETVRKRVCIAREKQLARQQKLNYQLSHEELKALISLSKRSKELLAEAEYQIHLTARGLDQVLRVARTVADLSNQEKVKDVHISEALMYRPQVVY